MTSYRKAGVDLDAASEIVDRIGPRVTSTWTDGVVGDFGGFAAGIQLPDGYRNPVLMMSTDGVGTKAEIARQAGSFDGLGHDLVAMVADDLAAVGAKPIALTDYIAVGRLDVELVETIVASVARACTVSGIALLGGEIAEHPGVMEPDQFDISATALGVVEAGNEIDVSAVAPGDVIVGVKSPNLRSNGFSLVRAIIADRLALDSAFPGTGSSVAEVLLEPSVIYATAIADLLGAVDPHALAHITGGGLPGNVLRVLPAHCMAVIETSRWDIPQVFSTLADLGDVSRDEMFRTFNMGIGFVIVLPEIGVDTGVRSLSSNGLESAVIGRVVDGDRAVNLV